MVSLGDHTLKLWFFLSVLLYFSNALRGASGEKIINVKFGFDLTQGENGAPSLKIRNFQESSEFNPRAAVGEDDDETIKEKKSSPSIRADSVSDSSETLDSKIKQRYQSSKEQDRSNGRSEEDSNDSDRRLSTRGLSPGEYEPEENVRIHQKFAQSSESDSDGHHRYKRSMNRKALTEKLRKRSREFFEAENLQVSKT